MVESKQVTTICSLMWHSLLFHTLQPHMHIYADTIRLSNIALRSMYIAHPIYMPSLDHSPVFCLTWSYAVQLSSYGLLLPGIYTTSFTRYAIPGMQPVLPVDICTAICTANEHVLCCMIRCCNLMLRDQMLHDHNYDPVHT